MPMEVITLNAIRPTRGFQSFYIRTLRPRQNGRHFADDIFKCIFLNENVWFPIKISVNCVPKGPIDNNAALAQIMAWRRPGDKPLSEPIMFSSTTHICVTRPQWVKRFVIDTGFCYARATLVLKGNIQGWLSTKLPSVIDRNGNNVVLGWDEDLDK